MNVFYILTRADAVPVPQSLTDPPEHKTAQTFFICPTLDAAQVKAEEQIDSVGGTWLIFKLRRIMDPTAIIIAPTPVE